MNITRRAAVTLLGSTALAPLAFRPAPWPMQEERGDNPLPQGGDGVPLLQGVRGSSDDLPVSGRVLPGLEALDGVVLPILEAHAIPGAQIAMAHEGRLMVARAYGFADVQARLPMLPETRMVLASVSKVITAQTILKLVDEGRITLEDRVFGWFRELRPPEGRREDPRLAEITIRMCLQHTGGWDRKESGDPSGWSPRIRRALHLERPPTPLEMIRYMKGVRLDFQPGTRQAYSNFGFVLLGAVIAAVTREEYPAYVQQHTLQPWGVHGTRVDEPIPNYFPGEARRYMLPAEHEVPGGNNRMVMAAGGWAANCVDMALMLTAIDGSRTGRPWLSPTLMQAMVEPAQGIAPISASVPELGGAPAGSNTQEAPLHWMGLGWDQVELFPPAQPGGPQRYSWAKDGGLAGIQTWVQHVATGTNFALLFNSSVPHGQETPGALGLVRPRVLEFIRGVKAWPVGDLFVDFTRDRAAPAAPGGAPAR